MAKKLGRPKKITHDCVVRFRISKKLFNKLQDIAAIESAHAGYKVCASEVIRDCLDYVVIDNERMRNCFRQSRMMPGRYGSKYLALKKRLS